jgi:hypothetical protein
MFRTSENTNEFAAALAAAQGEFKPIAKTRQGKIEGESKGSGKAYSFSYAYADIADVLSGVLPILSKHHISVMQPTVMDGGVLTIITRLTHASGQWAESDYPICSIQGDHKKMGGALTYGRRYALCSMIGVAPDEDIDGDGAEEPAPRNKTQPRNENARPATKTIDEYRQEPSPFDDEEIPYAPAAHEAAVSTKAIGWGREMKGCMSIPDLNAFKKTPEFKTAYYAMHQVDQEYLLKILAEMKDKLATADLRMAG